MTRKIVKWVIFVLAVLAVIRFSFYVEPLQEHREKELMKKFSPDQLVEYHWNNDLDKLLGNALDIKAFDDGMRADATGFSGKHGKSPGIGAGSCFLVKGRVKVTAKSGDAVNFDFTGETKARLLTKFIFTNTARDASGWFDADAFQNTMDFNSVSTCLNKIIVDKVAKPVIDSICAESCIEFWGAIEVSPEKYPCKTIDIVPLRIKLSGND